MKIKILTSNCKKGECGDECPYCRLSETFSSLAGSEEFHNEEGILQESPENIIPPAFNRFLALAKIGHPAMTEANLPQVTTSRGRTAAERGEKLQAQMADYIERNQMKSKAAQDVFAQYIVRYVGEPFETRRGNLINTNLNSVSVNEVFERALNRLNFGAKGWKAFQETQGFGYHGGAESEDTTPQLEQLWMEKQRAWFNLLDDFKTDSPTSEQWDGKFAQMVDNGASNQELLVYLGKQYKSRHKGIKKFFQKNPELEPIKAETDELVRRAWDYWQDQVASHSMGNLRKIGKFLEEEKFVGELGALLKKYPSYDEQDGATGDFKQRSSLYHANELIDNEMLKSQLEACEDGFMSAMQPNPDDPDDAKPCVMKEYDDGFFWWNRRASACDIAGEEMANCGASNYESSTLLILKEKVKNDSADVMDKLKGRIMVEYNAGHGEIMQILGFANSFPARQYWDKIKDLHEGLDKPRIDSRAFTHLAGMGRTDTQSIQEFIDFVGEKESRNPKSFWREDSHEDSFIDRLKSHFYDLEDEVQWGGRQRLKFKSKHVDSGGVRTFYAPITVEGVIAPLPFPLKPDSLSTEEHPSLERELFDSLVVASSKNTTMNILDVGRDEVEGDTQSHDIVKGLVENKIKRRIHSSIMDMPRDGRGDVIVGAGGAAEAATRAASTFEWTRYEVQTRYNEARKEGNINYPAKGRARFRLHFKFEIVPEVFTYEDIGNEDDPQGFLAHQAVLSVRKILGGSAMMSLLSDSIQAENLRISPPEESAPYDYSNPPENVVLSLAEIVQEMDALMDAGAEGTSMTDLTSRLEVLYRSFVTPRGNGYMNIDALNGELKDAWTEFVRENEYWSNEWYRLRIDSQVRVQEMGGQAVLDQAEREGDMTGADDVDTTDDSIDEVGQQRRYYGLEHAQGVQRFVRVTVDSETVGVNVRRILRDFDQFNPIGDWDHSNIAKAKLNAIDANYDFENMGLTDEEISKAANLVVAINRGDFDETDDDDDITPDEADAAMQHDDGWRPGMPTPGPRPDYEDPADIERDQARHVDFGGGAQDYADRFRQQTGQDYEEHERTRADAERERHDRLRGRANLFTRMQGAQNSRGWDYYSGTTIWQRTKEEMKEEGIFVDWLESLPDDSVIKQAELEDARREAGMTDVQNALIRRGAMLMNYIERTPRRVDNEAFQGTLQRFKNRMEEEGLWYAWWSGVPDSNPLKTSGVLDEDQTLVEARALVNNILGIKQSNRIKININENMGGSPDIQRSTTVDEHFLDFLEEKIPSLDVENPNEVKAVIWAIENNETAEQVFKALEKQGLVTRHMDSAVETTMWQIKQIQTIMTSHWFSKIEQLYEGKRKQTVGILPYRMIEGEIEFLIGEMTNIYHALPDETPEEGFQSKWTCFKGRVDDGEDEKSAARREFQEESTFIWDGQLDDSKIVQNKKVKIWLVDAADLDPSTFNRNDVHKITGDYLNGMPEVWSIGWFSPEETQSKLANNQKDLIPQAIEILTDSVDIPEEPREQGAPMAFALNENEDAKNLHIFDFDDTIAFTTSYTQVSVPEGDMESAELLSQLDQEPPGPPYALDQHGLDKMFRDLGSEEELTARGFDLDFSSFKTVASNSPLNPVIASRIEQCCLIGGEDPVGEFYVLTARSRAAERSIHQYLKDNGIEIDRKKIRGVEGGLKSARIKQWILSRSVRPEKVIFYDDSDNNIQDVATLRQDDDLRGITFELYPVDKEGNIPKKPLQETNYEHKRFKIRIGAK